ncbi:MAG: hypothetical protein CVU89_14240 [Firmicutes bacterium HGW-Firmicutes-14]|nr:MAG: hypothetical protein CVU89_14240 [Firmicutes bacterium HGW-Firmicutes-14]
MPQWRLFRKYDLSKTEDRLKAIIVVSGLVLAAFLLTAGAVKTTMSPEFCGKCHVMAPEYTTWKASSHLNIACTDCHIKPGLGNLIVHKMSAVKELYLYFTGTYDRPIQMSHDLEDEICMSCHSVNRGFTPSGDLIIPHDKHAARDVKCVECHSGVAHGNIVARELTKDGKYEVWTAEFGKKQMTKDYSEPKMNTCLDCHINPKKYGVKNVDGVTQACEACHTQISMPPDHKVADFGTSHGKLAAQNLDYCNKCHSYSLEAKDILLDDPVARYARGNVFCYECHQKRPEGHGDKWRMTHKKGVTGGDVSGCLICHNNEKPTPQHKAVPTYCIKCHGQQGEGTEPGDDGKQDGSSSSGKTTFKKYHPSGWRTYHPTIVKEKGASNEGCWNCHETNHCADCHTNKL